GTPLQAIVVNNKISNVCAAGDGVEASEQVCARAADVLGLPGGGESVLPLSTGVIGWRLPVAEMLDALPTAAAQLLQQTGCCYRKKSAAHRRRRRRRSSPACGPWRRLWPR
ncbi:MAG: bifunctional ornithine acetyltransferase/N-acetylglutamate synthase, partial [Pseudomonadota bacterium]|nr:bifunctional ornithine acetyltransferase/N-acetylglutamate synthase [Pseudomonadota bacterium]